MTVRPPRSLAALLTAPLLTAPLLTVPMLTALAATGTLLGTASPASAAGERPVAYLNADTGKATANTDVDAGSSCDSPDQADTMALGDESTGKGNVHVDACLFTGTTRVDTAAAFETTGVGVVFGCPDSDLTGPKTATKTSTSCLHTGYEAANSEYHVRLVSATAGIQTVRFCADPEGNGCADATDTSTVRITWGAPTGSVAAGGSGGLPVLPVGVALLALVGGVAATTLVLRTR